MSENKTLWQRCEALGQFEDYKDDHVEMKFSDGRWTILHDDHPILFIYEDRMQGSPWLADAILCHIERIRFGTTTDSKTYCQEDLNRAGIANVCRPIPDQLPDVTYVVEAPKEDPINGTRYRMCKDQPAQIDCRETKCRFYAGAGTCVNVSPALVLHEGSSFWCKSREPKDEDVVEAPKPTEPTQEQLKAIWDHVTHLTMEQEISLGIQYAFVGTAMHSEFQLHIKSVASCKEQWRVRIAQGSNGVFRAIEPFDLALACHRLGCFHVANSQVVVESPNQFVSIPVTEWQQLREATSIIQSILFPEVKEVEFEN